MPSKKPYRILPKSFLIFIIISLFFWVLTKLSKNYENSVQLEVEYVNLPKNKVIKNALPNIIDVQVKATGFKLLYTYFVTPIISINFSSIETDLDKRSWLYFENQKNKIQNQLSKNLKIQSFTPSKVKVEFDALETKKVPIKALVSITYKDNFDAYKDDAIKPDSIWVTGPKAVLDSLSFLTTTPVELVNVESNINQKLLISPLYKEKSILYKDVAITYQLKVDKFTEGSIEVPVTIIHKPIYQNITTFPSVVKLTYKVALNDYNKVAKNLFAIECDYKQAQENNLNFLIPKVVSSPAFVKDLHLHTKKIDFFITKE